MAHDRQPRSSAAPMTAAEEVRAAQAPTQPKTRLKYLQTSEDLAYGQIVIVTGRWILVLAGLLLALWNPGPINELRVQVVVILALAVANFYLHAQLLMRRPAFDVVVYGSSIADLAVITLLVIAQGGFKSNLFVFYFPAILAFSVAFATRLTFTLAGTAMGCLALISLATAPPTDANFQVMLSRLLMLAAVAICGNMYWRIEHKRRRAAAEAQEHLMAQIRERRAPAEA